MEWRLLGLADVKLNGRTARQSPLACVGSGRSFPLSLLGEYYKEVTKASCGDREWKARVLRQDQDDAKIRG